MSVIGPRPALWNKYLPSKEYIVIDGGVDEVDIEKYNMPVQKGNEVQPQK